MLHLFYDRLILTHPRLILALVLIVVGLLGTQAGKLEIDASSETLVMQDDSDLDFTREISQRYATSESLVIAYTPKTDLLDSDTLKHIREISEKIEKLEKVDSVLSIRNVPLLQSSDLPIKELLANIPTLESDNVDRKRARKELLNSPIYSENLVSEDFKTTALLINLKPERQYDSLLQKRNSLQAKGQQGTLTPEESAEYEKVSTGFKTLRDTYREQNHQMILDIRAIMDEHRDSGELFLGGVGMIADDVIHFIRDDLKIYGSMVLALLIFVLWFVFRQRRYIALPVLIASLSVMATTGLLGLFGWEVTVISSNFVSLQLIVTMSLIIHLIVRFRELLRTRPDASQKELVLEATLSMARPCFFVILTTVAGFGSLVASGILPVINLGWMMSAGVSISLLITFLVFPTAMSILPRKMPKVSEFNFAVTENLAQVVERLGTPIIVATVFIAIFGLSGASKLIVENSFIDYFKKSTEIYQGMEVIDRQLGGTTPLDLIIDFPKEEVADKVAAADTTADFLDSFEDEFTESKNDAQYWFTPQKMATVQRVHDYLNSIPEIGKVLSLGTMLEVGRTLNGGENLDSFKLGLIYNELPTEFKNIILAPYVDIEANQVRFSMRVIDSLDDLRRNELLQRIHNDLQTKVELEPDDFRLSGMMVLYNNMLQGLFNSQIKTLGVVVLILGAMFLILFRSISISIIAMIANVTPIGAVMGLMGWSGIPLDMMTITIAAISLGIAVDNTIHYLHRFKIEVRQDGDYLAAMHRTHGSIGYAMYYTSLAIILGFSILTLSNFIPTIYFGLLTVVAMIMALGADLLLLPRLLLIFKPFGRNPSRI